MSPGLSFSFDPHRQLMMHLVPLSGLASSEKKQLDVAEKASSMAYQAWKDGERQGLPKERLDDLKAKAMEKDEILKGMQDLCD